MAACSGPPDERGTGLISSVFGVTMFLVFMLVAVQVAYALYTRSTVGLAAYDAAQAVSGSDASYGGITKAESSANTHVETVLGSYGHHAIISWAVSQNFVSVTVSVTSPTVVPKALARAMGLADTTRTVVLRREHLP